MLIATSILLDGRTVFGPDELDPKALFYEAEERDDAAALDAEAGAVREAADRLPARTWWWSTRESTAAPSTSSGAA